VEYQIVIKKRFANNLLNVVVFLEKNKVIIVSLADTRRKKYM